MAKKNLNFEGFTLVEILIAIAVLGVMATTFIMILNPFLQFKKANDAKRKSDLRQITTLLNEYYNDNQKFPPAGACQCGTECYIDSRTGGAWIADLVPKYTNSLPVDPTNSGVPWSSATHVYSYGNVSCDGQTYDLTTQLENPQDPAACVFKDYTYDEGTGTVKHWCTGGGTLNNIYEYSPPF